MARGTGKDKVNVVEEYEENVQVKKVKCFDDLIEALPTTTNVTIKTVNGQYVEFMIQSIDDNVMEEIDAKYDKMLPAKPVKSIRPAGASKPVKVDVTEGPDYDEYIAQKTAIEKLRIGEKALMFLPDEMRPKVDPALTGQDKINAQIAALNRYIGQGYFMKLVTSGYELMGYDLNEKVEQAKNF